MRVRTGAVAAGGENPVPHGRYHIDKDAPHMTMPVRHTSGPVSACLVLTLGLTGCAEPEYDLSTPDAAIESMHQMVQDGNARLLGRLVHIEARHVTFDDGVTEASAIDNVIEKAGDMLGRLYGVALKLHDRFPDEVGREVDVAQDAADERGFGNWFGRILADPFGLLAEQRRRISAEDLGDGTAVVMLDGEPVLQPMGLLMRDVDGVWKIDVPIDLLREWRPDTREEWAVLASMMLAIENSLMDFERELDRGDFRSLADASERAGRLLGESVVVQSLIYYGMKRNAEDDGDAAS